MADLSDIPDEAVIAPVDIDALIAKYETTLRVIYNARSAGDHTFAGVLSGFATEVAAALPVLNTAKDSETVEPNLIMGNRPDGSPWVISAEFARSDVRVDAYGVLRLHGKAVAPAEAHRLATALLAAIAWLENDGAAKAESAASLRGEQGE